jgi:hypothetical protein
MARIVKNDLVRGARGNFGKQFVYKKRGKQTHIASMPDTSNVIPTLVQVQVRELFSLAALYAKAAMFNPEIKKQYKEKAGDGATAFNVAVRDYFKAPVVKSIDPSNYNGSVGSKLIVTAKDDFRVVSVKVAIKTATGDLVEEGEAHLNPDNLAQWIYTATQDNATLAGSVITATAKDRPGNSATLNINL